MMARNTRFIPLQWMGLGLLVVALVTLAGCNVKGSTASGSDAGKPALVAEPVIDQDWTRDDFAFPSEPPSLKRGKAVFENNCMSCHAQSFWQQEDVKRTLAYTTPIDYFLMLTTGEAPKEHHPTPQRKALFKGHKPVFRDNLSRDDRWAVIFYTRYLAGAGDIQAPNAKAPQVDAIFGGNCAVCHGKRGFADGPLHVGKTGNHEVANAEVLQSLQPAPANFHDYARMYNRTDAQLMKYICEGIYPSAMPSWYGNVHRDKDTGATVYEFDNQLISDLVRHIRTFAYNNDLDVDPAAAPKGLDMIAACDTTYTNQPWTPQMNKAGLSKKMPWTAKDQRLIGDQQQGGETH